ncbi:MAG TPA: hypothetical protein VFW62_03710 [bacterium]|nr:hypothetical protein [bacterium]
MEVSEGRRGEFPICSEETPTERIDRQILNPGGPRPKNLPLIQTREGFYDHQALKSITAGKTAGPIKLLSGSAAHLAVKSAAALKK